MDHRLRVEARTHATITRAMHEFAAMQESFGPWQDSSKTGNAIRANGFTEGLRANFCRAMWYFLANPDLDRAAIDPAVINEWRQGGRTPEQCDQLSAMLVHAFKIAGVVDNVDNDAPIVPIVRDDETFHYIGDWCVRHDRLRVMRSRLRDPSTATDEALLVLLMRYDWLSGNTPGYQMACPYLAALERACGEPVLESFASPLNATCRHYCSLFPDTDALWGSWGNWFDLPFDRWLGVVQANPPFVECLINAMANRLLDGLAARPDVTAVVFLPDWTDCAGLERLRDAAQTVLCFEPHAHWYCAGNAYRNRIVRQNARTRTLVFVLGASKRVERIAQCVTNEWSKSSGNNNSHKLTIQPQR